jgi:hypothetical protein
MAKERFEAIGDGKSLAMDDFRRSEFYRDGRRTTFTSRGCDKGFDAEMRRFVGTIIRGEEPAMRFDEIEAATRATLLAVQSLRTGQVHAL